MNQEREETPDTQKPTSEAKDELVYEPSTLPTLWMIIPALLLIAYGVMSR